MVLIVLIGQRLWRLDYQEYPAQIGELRRNHEKKNAQIYIYIESY